MLEIIDNRSPSIEFIKVDLPAFGLPIIVTYPDFVFIEP
ncbi:hypothetical protein ASZ90_004086 [hydrocarbon metagenome]|uniref:Uncharacterized protein n=1 Tax=hydrocarbon metagenome TaxID=938273 RepID=A0A0W8FYZ3_9ZZZZ